MDDSLYRFVNRLADRTGFAHPLFAAYARYGIAFFAILLVAGCRRARDTGDRRTMAAVLWAGAGAFAALGVAQVIGQFVDRARPYVLMPAAHVLIDRSGDFSFPSDHATAVGAVAAGLWLADRRLGFLAGILAALMAFSRVYVGVHYPGDVLAGLLLGAGTVMGLWPLAHRLLAPVLERLDGSALTILVNRVRPSGRGEGI